jgi:hypothetical protein
LEGGEGKIVIPMSEALRAADKNSQDGGEVRSSLKSVLKKFESFCNAATIHGFQYIVDQSLGIFFRVLWLIIITVSFTIAGFLISLSFKA